MKILLTFLAACALTLSAFAQTTNSVGQTLVPALKPIPLEWDYEPEEPVENHTFQLWDQQTNLVATLGTNDFRVIIPTNIVTRHVWSATLTNGLPRGTNNLSITVTAKIAGSSSNSPPLALKPLGEPLPPSAPRKR